jgi:hypothetical protein
VVGEVIFGECDDDLKNEKLLGVERVGEEERPEHFAAL